MSWLATARFRLDHELLPPALDRLREIAEGSPAPRQLVRHAHGWAPLDETHEQPPGFQVLQSCRQHLVPRALGALRELAEAKRSLLEHVQDQRVPGSSQHRNRALERVALRIHAFRHVPNVPSSFPKESPLTSGSYLGTFLSAG